FSLIIGDGEAYYVGSYAGLVLLGAAIGLVITMVMPQLPLAPAQEAQDRLRSVLTTKLKNLADLLDRDGPIDVREWERLYRDPWPYLREAHSALSEAQEATRGNRRARHYRNAVVALRMQGEAFERAAQLVDDMSKVVRDTERDDVEVLGLGQELRPYAVRTLRAMADVFDSTTGSSADAEAVHRAHESLDALTRASDEVRRRSAPGGGMLAASTIIMDMRRCLDLVKPADDENEVTIEAPTEASEASGPAERTEAPAPAERTTPPAGTSTEKR
ncbi:hypothetical protein PU560_06835, partial [Georgenia sp. 10Sc9-8]|nr:hypothetical protein [Georgenia halotolerans]